MKKIIYLAFAFIMMAMSACDNYVDIQPTGRKTVDSAATYLDLVAQPERAYNPMAFGLLNDNAWMLESNVIGKEYQSFDGINMTFNESADRLSLTDNNLYENMYNYIMRENIVIGNVDNSKGSDDIKQLAKAEARVMRVWDHFLAINTFAKAYNPATAAQDGGIAIVGEYNLEMTPKKSSVAEVYNFLISELNASVPLLAEKPKSIYHPSKAFGYALQSLVYLFHRDWQEAKDAAEKSLALNGELADYVKLKQAGGPTKSSMYGLADNPEILNYAYQNSNTDNFGYTFNYGIISQELVQMFESNDLRYSLFFTQSASKYYYDAGSGSAVWNSSITYKKFQYGAVGLRTAEVYLILAEAEARLGHIQEATDLVNKLREKRIEGADVAIATPSTQEEMMHIIIDERRKELLFGFHRFWDLKRLNTEPEYAKVITRTFPLVSTATEQKTYTLQPDSKLYIIPFPEAVRAKNPNITNNF